MNNQEELFDKLFDVLLNDAAKDYDSKPESDLPDDAELPDIIFSEQHEKKMKKIFVAERRKYALKRAGMYASRVAACIGAFAIISCITFVGVNSEFRVNIKNIIFNANDTNTDVSFADDNRTNTYSLDNVTFKYIPEGFSVSHTEQTDNIRRICFNNDNASFDITIRNIDSKVSVDTNTSNSKKIKINGIECFLSANLNKTILTANINNAIYTIRGDISENEIVKIVQNIEIR